MGELWRFMGLWVYGFMRRQKNYFFVFLVFPSQRLHSCFFYRFLSSSSFPFAFRIPLCLFLYSPVSVSVFPCSCFCIPLFLFLYSPAAVSVFPCVSFSIPLRLLPLHARAPYMRATAILFERGARPILGRPRGRSSGLSCAALPS